MILEKETFEVFGHYPSVLTHGSHKRILAACDGCGKIRETSKNAYRALCNSCAMKGKNNPMFGKPSWNLGIKATDEHKENISAAMKGKTNGLGYKHTAEEKDKMSAAHKGEKNHNYGKRGEESSNYKGGQKVSNARQSVKRRGLGHTHIYSVEEGEDEHHFTNEHVGGIPAEVHKRLGGRRKKHRTLVLQWLKMNDKKKYLKVLCVLAKEPLYIQYKGVIK